MTTNTTTNLKLALRRWYNNPIVWIFAVANLFVVVAAGASIGRYDPSTVIANLPTPEIIVLVATAPPVPTPAGITVAAVQPVKYVTAFAAPAGDLLGPIPAPEASAIVARFGDDWLMTTWNGGPAWVRAADVGLRIADLKPERVVVVSAGDGGNTPAPVYQVTNDGPPDDFYTDIPTPPADFVQALIGPDPDAPACVGANGKPSVICGGITNREARAALQK